MTRPALGAQHDWETSRRDPAGATAASGEVEKLYRQHSPTLVRQLARRTGCRELARELANETFLRLLRLAPGKLRSIAEPEAYLRRISSNLLCDWARSSTLANLHQQTIDPAEEELVDQLSVLESRDLLHRLEHAIDKMRPKTRKIFLAHRIEGLTYAQIAEQNGLSIKGVEKQMGKAIAKIDRLLDRP